MKCSACGEENLAGAEFCNSCEVTLVHFKSDEAQTTQSRQLKDPIKKAGLRDAVTNRSIASAKDVIRQMKDKGCGCALIVDGGKLSGILTEHDILIRVAKPDADLSQIHVGDIMTKSPVSLLESDPIAFAINKMAVGNFRHVPVKREDGTYAVFSVRDALKYFF